jgi:hypothetical protein
MPDLSVILDRIRQQPDLARVSADASPTPADFTQPARRLNAVGTKHAQVWSLRFVRTLRSVRREHHAGSRDNSPRVLQRHEALGLDQRRGFGTFRYGDQVIELHYQLAAFASIASVTVAGPFQKPPIALARL